MGAQQRVALITGASSGIGEAFADVFASEGFALVITARREPRLQALADRLRRDQADSEVVACDLATEGAVERRVPIQRRGLAIDALVNNAGFGAAGGYTSPSWDVHENMLQVMVVAASELTNWFLPGMIERRYGRIVNVASVGGLVHAGTGTLVRPGELPDQLLRGALARDGGAWYPRDRRVPGPDADRVPRCARHERYGERDAAVDVDGRRHGGAARVRCSDVGEERVRQRRRQSCAGRGSPIRAAVVPDRAAAHLPTRPKRPPPAALDRVTHFRLKPEATAPVHTAPVPIKVAARTASSHWKCRSILHFAGRAHTLLTLRYNPPTPLCP